MSAMRQNVPSASARPHGRRPCRSPGLLPISPSSAEDTPGFSWGQSRNHQYHAAAHTTPALPNTKKAARQP